MSNIYFFYFFWKAVEGPIKQNAQKIVLNTFFEKLQKSPAGTCPTRGSWPTTPSGADCFYYGVGPITPIENGSKSGNFLDKDMKRENLSKIVGQNSCHIGNRFMGLCRNWFVDLCGNRFVGLCGNRFVGLCGNRFVGLCGNRFVGLCGNRFMGLCGNRFVGLCGNQFVGLTDMSCPSARAPAT